MRRFHFKHFSLCHDNATMKVGTDAVMLGAWVEVKPSDVVLDIGTGCGVLALMMAQKGVARVDAVDLDEASAMEAADNFEASQWRDRLYAFHGDIRKFGYGRKYDLIISNPPFFVDSFKCDADRKNQARHTDTSLSFTELVLSVKHLLKPDGRFALVLPERESHDFLSIASQYGLYPRKQQILVPVAGKDPNRINWEMGFEAVEQVQRSELVLRDEQGRFTTEYNEFLKDFYLG